VTVRIFCFLLFIPFVGVASEIKPFTSDGCSIFPDGTSDQQSLWLDCCIRHDINYWKGGNYEDRLNADLSLEQCVNRLGESQVANIMLSGVRVGGSPYFPTSLRWGYGWPFPRGYKALSSKEQLQVKNELEKLQILIKSISDKLEIAE
jgi:hypothetical protein